MRGLIVVADVCMQHSGMCAEVENIKKQVERIPTLEEAVVKLTMMIEQIQKEQQQKDQQNTNNQVSFWNTETGKKIPLYVTIVVCTVIISLAGSQALEAIKAVSSLPLK
jgi:hypothetical protein